MAEYLPAFSGTNITPYCLVQGQETLNMCHSYLCSLLMGTSGCIAVNLRSGNKLFSVVYFSMEQMLKKYLLCKC